MKPLHTRPIKGHHPGALVVAAVAVASVLASGGCGDVRAVDRAGSASTTDAAQVPPAVVEVLLRGEIEIADASFDGGMSAPEAVAAFDELYQSVPSDAAATPYAVTVASSQETRLAVDSEVRMVHLPNVEQDGSGPVSLDHSATAPTIIETDMFAFFEAGTGEHLVTVYIGPTDRDDPGLPATDWTSGNLTITTERRDNAVPPIPARLHDTAADAAELVDWHDTEFADTYYDPASDRVVLIPTTTRGRELARAFVEEHPGLASISPGGVSHAELMDAGRALIDVDRFLNDHAYQLGVSHGSLGIDIHIDAPPPDRAELRRQVTDLPFHVTLIVRKTNAIPGDDGLD